MRSCGTGSALCALWSFVAVFSFATARNHAAYNEPKSNTVSKSHEKCSRTPETRSRRWLASEQIHSRSCYWLRTSINQQRLRRSPVFRLRMRIQHSIRRHDSERVSFNKISNASMRTSAVSLEPGPQTGISFDKWRPPTTAMQPHHATQALSRLYHGD